MQSGTLPTLKPTMEFTNLWKLCYRFTRTSFHTM